MKMLSCILCSLLYLFTSFVPCVGQNAREQGTYPCDAIQKGEFRTALARSIGTREIEEASIDTHRGSSNSELVAVMKPISKVTPIKAAKGLHDTIRKSVLSAGFDGTSIVTGTGSDSICSVSFYGHDRGMRVRIEADATALTNGSVRLKIVCVTSPEQKKGS